MQNKYKLSSQLPLLVLSLGLTNPFGLFGESDESRLAREMPFSNVNVIQAMVVSSPGSLPKTLALGQSLTYKWHVQIPAAIMNNQFCYSYVGHKLNYVSLKVPSSSNTSTLISALSFMGNGINMSNPIGGANPSIGVEQGPAIDCPNAVESMSVKLSLDLYVYVYGSSSGIPKIYNSTRRYLYANRKLYVMQVDLETYLLVVKEIPLY